MFKIIFKIFFEKIFVKNMGHPLSYVLRLSPMHPKAGCENFSINFNFIPLAFVTQVIFRTK